MTPRLVVAAPASGCGKTTVATGLMAAYAARGLRVSAHKVGPDYIDPSYHAIATGRPGRNLDPWLVGEERITPLFGYGSRGADVAVVEGVMGLYDGAAGKKDFASTAHVAKLLAAPVVLVVDAAAAGRSVAATVQGFAGYDTAVRIGGVILNRIGSDRHEHICRQALEESGIPVLGAVRRSDAVVTPSRHLGLIPAAERRREAVHMVQRLGALIAESCDLQELSALARSAPPLTVEPWSPHHAVTEEGVSPGGGPQPHVPRVAVAEGAAFTFCYAENVELLQAAGAQVVSFDPLRDEELPEETRGLIIGGGFPELFADELAANERLRKEIAELTRSGAPVVAECAGLLYLARTLDGKPMCGVLDVSARMTNRLTLGYRDAVADTDSVLVRTGERVRGHEFHRTACDPQHGDTAVWRWNARRPEGFVSANCVASYLHLHWAGEPRLARRFVEAC